MLNDTVLSDNQTVLVYGIEPFNWKLFNFIIITVPCTLIGMFDFVTNIVNVCVFAAQGLTSSVEIAFFTIAITDLLRAFLVQFENLCINSYADDIDLPVVLLEVYYVLVNWPLGCVIRASLHATVYITLERCLCIMLPLKVRNIVNKKATIAVLAGIMMMNLLTLYPVFSTLYLTWSFRPLRNKTLLGLGFLRDKSEPLKATYLLHIVLIVGGLGLLATFTAILVTRLHYNRIWRMQNFTNLVSRKYSISSRDRKSAKLVIVIAILFVICYLPMVTSTLASYFIPDLSFNGKYDTVIRYSFGVTIISLSINSAVTILVYMNMSTNYRTTFKRLFYFSNDKIEQERNTDNIKC